VKLIGLMFAAVLAVPHAGASDFASRESSAVAKWGKAAKDANVSDATDKGTGDTPPIGDPDDCTKPMFPHGRQSSRYFVIKTGKCARSVQVELVFRSIVGSQKPAYQFVALFLNGDMMRGCKDHANRQIDLCRDNDWDFVDSTLILTKQIEVPAESEYTLEALYGNYSAHQNKETSHFRVRY
jgi:hypothetical protein